MRFRPAAVLVLSALVVTPGLWAQNGETLDTAPQKPRDSAPVQVERVPSGVILIPGAAPAASDAVTPVPEAGSIADGVYQNRYFGLTVPIAPGWKQQFQGPPPSDSGYYVLAQLTANPDAHNRNSGSLLIAAQDQFFALTPAHDAMQSVSAMAAHLNTSFFAVERQPAQVNIAGHQFVRMDYSSPGAGLHWYVLATEVRCHVLQFVLSGRDTRVLDAALANLAKLNFGSSNGALASPVCVNDYAASGNVVQRLDPVFTEKRFNPIPVRIIIGKDGTVKHVHVISAFPGQAKAITDALMRWGFRPHLVNGEPVEVETGLMFGTSPRTSVQQSAATR